MTLLAEHGDVARVLAGGQSLVTLMNLRLTRPGVLVEINDISELAYVQPLDGGMALGAMTRDASLERSPLAASRFPLLLEASHSIGHPAIRNRSTVGGSIAHADPAAELPTVMLALDAEFVVRNTICVRTVAASDFFQGFFQTALEPDELLTEVRLPGLPARSGSTFVEFARREGDDALAGVAAVITIEEDGTIANARLGLCSVGPTPVRPRAAEALLRSQHPGPEAWLAAAAAVVAALDDPPSDIHGSADDRRHLASILTVRALTLATERAERNS